MVYNCKSRLGGDNPVSHGNTRRINAPLQCFLQYLWIPKPVTSALVTELLGRSRHWAGSHSTNRTWTFFFKSQSVRLNENSFLSTFQAGLQPCFLIFADTIFSPLISKRYIYFAGFSSLHQRFKTQGRVNFVLAAVPLANRTCLSPSLWLLPILFKAGPCSGHLQLPCCEASQELLNSSPQFLSPWTAAVRTAWVVTHQRRVFWGKKKKKGICAGLRLWSDVVMKSLLAFYW